MAHDPSAEPRRNSPAGTWSWLALAFAAVALVAFRLHAFNLPLETDECNYAYIGKRLLAGDLLYIDVWDHQPPGVFVLFAGVIALFRDQPEVFRWMAVAFSLVSLVLIFAIVHRAAGPAPAALAAVLFAIVSSDPGTAGEGCNREIYMTTLILAAWYFATPGGQRSSLPGDRRAAQRSALPRPPSLFAAGTALALASALKPIVAIHWLALAVCIVLSSRGATDRDHAQTSTVAGTARRLAAFGIGPAILWAATFAYFRITGRWTEFIDALLLANVTYGETGEPLPMRFLRFFAPVRHPFIFDSALAVWLAGGSATIWLAVDAVRRRNQAALLILLLVVSSYIAVCLPGRFWPHYYYLLIAPLVLAVSLAAGRLADRLPQRRTNVPTTAGRTYRALMRTGAYGLLPLAALYTQYRHYLAESPLGITIERYNTRDFWGRAQGLNVKSVTEPDDTLFVFGNDASIYYYSDRRCASRYTMITALAEGMAGADQRRRTLVTELTADRPRLILLLFDVDPWPEWKAFLDEYYGRPVGVDFRDGTREPIMFVLARNDAAIAPIDWNWDRSQLEAD